MMYVQVLPGTMSTNSVNTELQVFPDPNGQF